MKTFCVKSVSDLYGINMQFLAHFKTMCNYMNSTHRYCYLWQLIRIKINKPFLSHVFLMFEMWQNLSTLFACSYFFKSFCFSRQLPKPTMMTAYHTHWSISYSLEVRIIHTRYVAPPPPPRVLSLKRNLWHWKYTAYQSRKLTEYRSLRFIF